MADDLQGRVVLITGASGGIGGVAVTEFAAAGATVIAAARRPPEQLAAPGVVPVGMDIGDEDSVRAVLDMMAAEYAGLDAAINVAGVLPAPAPVAQMELSDWDSALAVNLTGTMLCVKHQMRVMLAAGRGGSIVNVGSSLGIGMARPAFGAYAVSKAGVHVLTEIAALEGAPANIRVNTLSPGPVRTEMSKRPGETDAERDARAGATVALNRVADPVEIVNAAMWLASPSSSFVTGHDLVVDGGQVLYR